MSLQTMITESFCIFEMHYTVHMKNCQSCKHRTNDSLVLCRFGYGIARTITN